MIDQIAFNDAGLVPVIAQHFETKQVLMVAWMNEAAFCETVESQRAVYFSRSRQRLWRKGEESGHAQIVKEIRIDCDGDTVLLLVDPIGGISCHTGREHCFFRKLDEANQWQVSEAVLKDPSTIYQSKSD